VEHRLKSIENSKCSIYQWPKATNVNATFRSRQHE
jgi:hypothetical protein